MSRVIENPYENFIALSRYARWLESENRRETWGETVDRYFDFMLKQLKTKHNYVPNAKDVADLREAVFNRVKNSPEKDGVNITYDRLLGEIIINHGCTKRRNSIETI